jgi:hypothetical protein
VEDRTRIEKLCQFVAKNGPGFEQVCICSFVVPRDLATVKIFSSSCAFAIVFEDVYSLAQTSDEYAYTY